MNEIMKTGGAVPAELYRQATDVAGLCREIVMKTAQMIAGRKYVRVEGWTSIATTHGCVASIKEVQPVDGGIRAVAEIKRIDNGLVIASAEGFVGDDEPMWAKRPVYARRAMAQTRAISRACRSAFCHVVVLIDSNLSTTPAEEVPDEGFDHPKGKEPVKVVEIVHETSKPVPATTTPPKAQKPVSTDPSAKGKAKGIDWRKVCVHFGKRKGCALGDLTPQSLHWYAEDWLALKQSEIDGGKEIKGGDRELYEALMARQSEKEAAEPGSVAEPGDEDYIPF